MLIESGNPVSLFGVGMKYWLVWFSQNFYQVFCMVIPCWYSAWLFPPSLSLSLFRFRSVLGFPQVLSVVHVDRRSDEGLDEIEDCWQLRDSGYNTIWVSEVRYRCLHRCYPLLPLLPPSLPPWLLLQGSC